LIFRGLVRILDDVLFLIGTFQKLFLKLIDILVEGLDGIELRHGFILKLRLFHLGFEHGILFVLHVSDGHVGLPFFSIASFPFVSKISSFF
jgi:hypothetical protein